MTRSQDHKRYVHGYDADDTTEYPGSDYEWDWGDSWPSGPGYVAPEVITATLPTMYAGALYVGQVPSDVPHTVYDETNYSSTAGTIRPEDVTSGYQVNGVDYVSGTLTAGQSVRFYYRVTDEVGTPARRFYSDPLTVGVYGTSMIMRVQTTTPSESFTIPCQNLGVFDAVIDWGDGTVSDITSYNDADLAHTYAIASTYTVNISGTFPNIYFNGGGDASKVKRVNQLGAVGWVTLASAFYGCNQLTYFKAAPCDVALVTDMSSMLRGLSSATTINLLGMDVSNVTTMEFALSGLTALPVISISDWTTSSLVNVNSMFAYSTGTRAIELISLDISSVTSAFDFAIGSNGFTQANYSEALEYWAGSTVQLAVEWNFASTTYSATVYAERNSLIMIDSWTIIDGGVAGFATFDTTLVTMDNVDRTMDEKSPFAVGSFDSTLLKMDSTTRTMDEAA